MDRAGCGRSLSPYARSRRYMTAGLSHVQQTIAQQRGSGTRQCISDSVPIRGWHKGPRRVDFRRCKPEEPLRRVDACDGVVEVKSSKVTCATDGRVSLLNLHIMAKCTLATAAFMARQSKLKGGEGLPNSKLAANMLTEGSRWPQRRVNWRWRRRRGWRKGRRWSIQQSQTCSAHRERLEVTCAQVAGVRAGQPAGSPAKFWVTQDGRCSCR